MNKIYNVIQLFFIPIECACGKEHKEMDFDILSTWTTKELADEEVKKLKIAGYKHVSVYPCRIFE